LTSALANASLELCTPLTINRTLLEVALASLMSTNRCVGSETAYSPSTNAING
jgi:hypothetical protein